MMLYSEEKERQNRFILSLKIALPFAFVLIVFSYIFFIRVDFTWEDTILFIILFLCYIYYIIYLLYFGFKKTLIDPITKVFNREEILKIISKTIKNKNTKNIVLFKIRNIDDINDRYGFKIGDEILYLFVLKFSKYMNENGFNKIPIGRYSEGYFIFDIKLKITHLEYILKTFERKISNEGINDIEIKIDYSVVQSDFDNNINNIINYLFSKINHKDEFSDIKILTPDVFDQLVCYAIKNENFEIKYQTSKSCKNNDDCLSLIVKINSSEIGEVSKTKISQVAVQNGFEVELDKNIISFLSKNIDFSTLKNKIILEISPVTIRNNDFKNYILSMISKNKIDPKKIVFEFNEKQTYPEILRFAEIIKQFKEIGFYFALNHFGGNNASYEYYKFLDIDFIIYDIEFNKNFKNKKIRKIFNCFNNISKELGIKSMIRFVDKKNFYDELYISGIDYIQGFYIDKPLDIKGLK